MVQMSKQMKARHHTRRPPRRVGLWCYGVGFLEESIHKLSEGPPGIPQFQHPSLVGAWEDLSWCFFHVLHFNKFVKAPLFYWCFCCWWYDMLMWWNSMFPHRSEKKKTIVLYDDISMFAATSYSHVPWLHPYSFSLLSQAFSSATHDPAPPGPWATPLADLEGMCGYRHNLHIS